MYKINCIECGKDSFIPDNIMKVFYKHKKILHNKIFCPECGSWIKAERKNKLETDHITYGSTSYAVKTKIFEREDLLISTLIEQI